MGKPKREKNYECVSEAKYRFAPMPARKARLVCDLIRGKSVKEALDLLKLTHKPSAAPAVMKVLKSARANAVQKKVNDPDSLIVSQVFVDGAFMLKRLRAAPMGRAVRVRKRFCHITIRLNHA
ncbi:MAG: 50S ribosomal protein L22 [Candidatus Hydrogenedentota bacterium]|jgi:large subunit ribosomal protein L22|uniref:Large ribosomal subunit protein uL22 n=1 Tax=Sumerlaea chitinivorans TaxID=2250252 RepID=A0A2Z4Y2V3_SUMC1|nr:LSU ribosomal protein L22p (L17e) [Candidatus Sumerlaea chitinivorans]RMH25884.1 MAG: 50S ribosomal protein L22 [Candidatus Hydrogenedentota bacterium]GIX45325.1 MAG: 50S ribosomal protein L22 [Candidatus Sumerlaea sp.]